LLPLAELSRHSAEAALRILQGENPGEIRPAPARPDALWFDWRELKRWGISEKNLPRGSEVRFRQATFWERNWRKTAVISSVVLAQAGIILLLLKNRAKRLSVEHELRESEARFRTVANAAPVLIWMSGRDKLCTFVNKSWLDFTGRTLEQEIGDGWVNNVHSADVTRCLKIYHDCFDARQPFMMEYRVRRHDGVYRWISDHGVPRYDDQGRFAGYIGSCLDITERKQSERTARELSGRLISAQEGERARLARELHDDITQRLARLAIDVGLAERVGVDGSPAERMRAVREGLVRVSEDVHSLSYRLHPQMLEDLGLEAALKAECERFGNRQSVSAELKTQGLPEPLTMDVSLCLFRVTQEALRNVGRHARAQRVEVTVRGLDGGVQLAVHDDGIGFSPAAIRSRATLGQASMRERVRLLGGEFELDSAPGHGTTVLAWVPVNGGSK
jgi:PAS domain S-box-containing protein